MNRSAEFDLGQPLARLEPAEQDVVAQRLQHIGKRDCLPARPSFLRGSSIEAIVIMDKWNGPSVGIFVNKNVDNFVDRRKGWLAVTRLGIR